MKKILLSIILISATFAHAQNGISWGMGMNVASNSHGNLHPRMALDRARNPMMVWGRMSDNGIMFSRWTGTAFSMPKKINPTGFLAAAATWMGPDIAAHGDTVYIVFKRAPEVVDTNYCYILTSYDAGQNFQPPVRLEYIADSISRFPTVETDALGNPIVAFMKFNSQFLDSRWVVTRSADHGKTFSTDVKASGWSGAGSEVCDCCPGALLSVGSKSLMLYRDNKANIRDIWTGVSNNNGAAYSQGYATDNKNWMIMSCPSSGPDAVSINDSVYSVYLSAATASKYRIYMGISSLSNPGLGRVVPMPAGAAGLSQQNFPRIARDGKALAVVWKQSVNGLGQLPLLFAKDVSNGFPKTYDTLVLKDAINADVAMANGKIWVVWEDDNAGTLKFRMGSYQGAATRVAVKPAIQLYPNPGGDVLNISGISSEGMLSIWTMDGKKLMEIPFEGAVDVSALTPGLYWVQISTPGKVYSAKWVKE